MDVEIIKPYGYCNGVLNSIEVAKKAILTNNKLNTFVLGPLVHNEIANRELTDLGANIVDIPDEQYSFYVSHLTKNDQLVLRAHGTSESVYQVIADNKITAFDATCPIVKKINGFIKSIDSNEEIIYIGKKDHPESRVSISYAKGRIVLYDINQKFSFKNIKTKNPIIINQSTISDITLQKIYSEIKKHVPNARINEFICPAVNDRQKRLIEKMNKEDMFIIVGSNTSSNTRSLLDITHNCSNNDNSRIINSIIELKEISLNNYKKVYIISGTSTPNQLVEDIYKYIKEL